MGEAKGKGGLLTIHALFANCIWVRLASALQRDLILRHFATFVNRLCLSLRIVPRLCGRLLYLPDIDGLNVSNRGDHVDLLTSGLLCRRSADQRRALARSRQSSVSVT